MWIVNIICILVIVQGLSMIMQVKHLTQFPTHSNDEWIVHVFHDIGEDTSAWTRGLRDFFVTTKGPRSMLCIDYKDGCKSQGPVKIQ